MTLPSRKKPPTTAPDTMTKKSLVDFGREWLDTLVVALSVAMAFRAYFYQPFNIPTGSMQPTLYGNHVQACEKPGILQKTPLKWLNWLLTGRDYKEVRAPFSGHLYVSPRGDGRFALAIVAPDGRRGPVVNLPNDALGQLPVSPGGRVQKGQRLFAGYDTTGDFIFVNRWLWNFRRPHTGEVMIFSTTGIAALQQGTHYIKRMKAAPGETYMLEHPVNGQAPVSVTMGPDEYFACGDNFNNSFDSRYWGAVPGRNLRGVASCVFWPIVNPRLGGIK